MDGVSLEPGQAVSVEDQSGSEPEPALTLPLVLVELIAKDQELRPKTATLWTILGTAQVQLNNIFLEMMMRWKDSNVVNLVIRRLSIGIHRVKVLIDARRFAHFNGK